jgi:ribosomal-protein-alanine N-acetyltransferase
MLKGKIVTLRPVQEDDLPVLYEHTLDIENRGDFYPRHIYTLADMRKELAENGMWNRERPSGLLVLVDNESGKVTGQIAFFPTAQYMDEMEIGYINFDRSARRRGAMTEALTMLTWYVFNTIKTNRIRLTIVPDNTGSRRVAEKSGYQHEGTMRGCFFNNGQHYDMELYGITRADVPSSKVGKVPGSA